MEEDDQLDKFVCVWERVAVSDADERLVADARDSPKVHFGLCWK
jgi:hypothetical protein